MNDENKNSIILDSSVGFPLAMDEYYYRYRISSIEKAKSEYNKCINVLLKNNDDILSDVSDKAEIIDRLRFHYENFNNFANILIEKRGIESKEDFIRLMEILYCIVHDTIIFVSDKYGFLKSKKLRKKYSFLDDSFYDNCDVTNDSTLDKKYKKKLSYILERIVNVQYFLNPDDPVNVLSDKYGIFVVAIVFLLAIGIVAILFLMIAIILINITTIPDNIIIESSLIISTVLSFYWFIKFINSAGFNLTLRRSRAYTQTYRFVIHPYKSTNNLKFATVLKYLKGFVAFIKSLKE